MHRLTGERPWRAAESAIAVPIFHKLCIAKPAVHSGVDSRAVYQRQSSAWRMEAVALAFAGMLSTDLRA